MIVCYTFNKTLRYDQVSPLIEWASWVIHTILFAWIIEIWI